MPAAVNLKHKMKSFINTSAPPPIAASLNSVAPGANPNPRDAHAVMHLCPLETVAKEKFSPFCSMFPEEDFQICKYVGDLQEFYNRGCAYIVPPPLTRSSSHCPLGMGVPWDRSRRRVRQRTHRAPHKFPCTSQSANQQDPSIFVAIPINRSPQSHNVHQTQNVGHLQDGAVL